MSMIELLKDICNKKEYVSIYTNKYDSSKFCYGRILSYDTRNFLFFMVSPSGCYDGYLVKSIDDILRINRNDQYNTRMKRIVYLNEAENLLFESIVDPQDILKSVLLQTQEIKKIVSVELNNSGIDDIVGFVNAVDEDICKIEQIDFYGNNDGIAYLRIKDITQISIDSSSEQQLLKLSCFFTPSSTVHSH